MVSIISWSIKLKDFQLDEDYGSNEQEMFLDDTHFWPPERLP